MLRNDPLLPELIALSPDSPASSIAGSVFHQKRLLVAALRVMLVYWRFEGVDVVGDCFDVDDAGFFEGLVTFSYLRAVLRLGVVLGGGHGPRVIHEAKEVVVRRGGDLGVDKLFEGRFLETAVFFPLLLLRLGLVEI